jgi:hypothetical protein
VFVDYQLCFSYFRAEINNFYVVHENGGLYACSKGRPTKALTKKRLECPEQIEEEVAGLIKDYLLLLNNKCKMLVLVSMATDKMIRLVSMYPEVWFMDTTAGECISLLKMSFVLPGTQINMTYEII